jgi:hypothetical protein
LAKVVIPCLLVVVASAANDLASMRASARAHACCAKTRFACAGRKSVDHCCRTMRHTAAQLAPAAMGSVDAPEVGATPAVVHIDIPALAIASFHSIDTHAFKRPHDPPHLHTFTLLI